MNISEKRVVTQVDFAPEVLCIPSGFDELGTNALSFHDSVLELELPDTCSVVSDSACMHMYGLRRAVLPNVQYIGHEAFSYCERLHSVEFPNVREIGSYAFRGCGFRQLSLPSSLRRIDTGAFSECLHLESITAEGGRFSVDDGVLCGGGSILCYPAGRCGSYKSSVLEVSSQAFRGAHRILTLDLTSVRFIRPEGLTGCTVDRLILPSDLVMAEDAATHMYIGDLVLAGFARIPKSAFRGSTIRRVTCPWGMEKEVRELFPNSSYTLNGIQTM